MDPDVNSSGTRFDKIAVLCYKNQRGPSRLGRPLDSSLANPWRGLPNPKCWSVALRLCNGQMPRFLPFCKAFPHTEKASKWLTISSLHMISTRRVKTMRASETRSNRLANTGKRNSHYSTSTRPIVPRKPLPSSRPQWTSMTSCVSSTPWGAW